MGRGDIEQIRSKVILNKKQKILREGIVRIGRRLRILTVIKDGRITWRMQEGRTSSHRGGVDIK